MPYEWAWPKELSIHAKVTWSQLYTYDILDDGQAPEDDTLSFLSNDTFQHAIDYVRARGNSMK